MFLAIEFFTNKGVGQQEVVFVVEWKWKPTALRIWWKTFRLSKNIRHLW